MVIELHTTGKSGTDALPWLDEPGETTPAMSPQDAQPDPDEIPDHEDPVRPGTTDERAVDILLTVLMPLLITLAAFGVVILAFSEWKLY